MRLVLFLILLISIISLLLAGCGEKPECKMASDCEENDCYEDVSCVENKCTYTGKIEGCCGNKICEDDYGEDNCNCPKDCKTKCEGKPKVAKGRKEVDATYLQYLCENKKCIMTIDEDDVVEQTFVDEKAFSHFTWSTQYTYNNPFNIDEDFFTFKIELKDEDEELVYPIKINKIMIKEKGELYGETTAAAGEFNAIGDAVTVKVSITKDMKELEIEKRLSYVIEFEYTKNVKKGFTLGQPVYEEEPVRNQKFEKSFSKKIFLLNPTEEK